MSRSQPTKRREGGLTIIEIMVSMLLLGIAAAFVFAIQVRASAGFRDQATVAETQQTLRSAMDLIEHDVREAGFYAIQIQNKNTGSGYQASVAVQNNVGVLVAAPGTDVITVQYGDTSKVAHVQTTDPGPCPTTVTTVDARGTFQQHDVVFATHMNLMSKLGYGCLFEITDIATVGSNATFTHAGGGNYNLGGSTQCSNICDVWTEGGVNNTGNNSNTIITLATMRSYRIKPGDRRGVLQMSPSGMMVANDWQDLAVGIIDLQAALRVYIPGAPTDQDGDGDPLRDWYSSSNMATILDPTTGAQLLNVSVTLVAKSTKDISGPTRASSPDVFEAGKPINFNSIGDRTGTALPVTDPSSMYYGKVIFRSYTKVVDIRNAGVGVGM